MMTAGAACRIPVAVLHHHTNVCLEAQNNDEAQIRQHEQARVLTGENC